MSSPPREQQETSPPREREQIAADPAVVDDDTDSTADSESLRGSTSSLTSSILDYRKIHGRTFQTSKTTEYWAPNDNKHLTAFDVSHHWLTMMLDDELYAAPIGDNPSRILDAGAGSGGWAIDMADKFPDAEVIGVDISPTMPGWVPPNLSFQVDDIQQEWTFEEGSFDFIHLRYMHGAVADWPKLYDQMYKSLKPGGWFQHIEPNIELRADNPEATDAQETFDQWAKLFYAAGDAIGREFRFSVESVTKYAHDAGFKNITGKTFVLPHGPWPKDKRLKEIGDFAGLYLDLSMDGFALYPIGEIMGWSKMEVDIIVAKMRRAIRNPRTLSNNDMIISYGQKPLA